jgi:hypothetical protein
MDPTADLGAALEFVTGRIEEQAKRAGEPLTEEQRFLLHNLPTVASMPIVGSGDPGLPLYFVPRDTTYERLCALAKRAYRNDLELNPALLDWEFAFTIAKLNHNPMCWLLQWAGVKQHKPWWDRWLLLVAALLFIISTMVLLLLVVNQPWASWRWTAVGAGYITGLLLMYFASRRIEECQSERNIERFRRSSRFGSSLGR